MAEWHVRQGGTGDGSRVERAFGSLAAAARVARPGDTVIVAGIFRELFRPPAGTTWMAANGQAAVIDGGWDGKRKPAKTEFLVGIGQENVTLLGLTVRNSTHVGIMIGQGGHGAAIEECLIEDCYDGAIALNGMSQRVRGVRVLNCTMRRLSRSWKFDQSGVGGCCRFKWAEDAMVSGCHLYAGYGEGVAAGVGTRGMVIENNVIHDLMHLAIYVNRAQDVIVRGNVIYNTGDPLYRQPDGDVGRGIVVGDETRGKDDKDERWQNSANVLVENNLVVGTSSSFVLANGGQMKGNPPVWDGYLTPITDLVVRRNTFVAGKHAKLVVVFQETRQGAKAAGRFEYNVIIADNAAAGVPALVHDATGVKLTGNYWTARPERMAEGDSVVAAGALLVGPLGDLTGAADDNDFYVGRYRPKADGALVVDGRATAGALQPPLVEEPEPPPEPEPELSPVDWDGLLDLVVGVVEGVAGAGAAQAEVEEQVAVASLALGAAFERNGAARVALDEAAGKLSELLLKVDELRERGKGDE